MDDNVEVSLHINFSPNAEFVEIATTMFNEMVNALTESGDRPLTIEQLELLKTTQLNTAIIFNQLAEAEIARLREQGETDVIVDIPDCIPEDGN